MVLAELGVVAGFTVSILLFWSPLLAVTRLRELFRWPTSWLVVNYLFVGGGMVAVQTFSYLAIILLTAGTGTVTGSDAVGIVGGVIVSNLLLPAVISLAALRILPERGYWTPTGDGLNGHIALGIGVIWYGVITSVGFVLIGLALMFAKLPM
ncbi:hypothetical protein [Haloferax volcanii]|uniref:hypothetical protein n=1 Tax=Haloferax volcanii TaxID=2246 RepID=UPI0023DA2F5F|nr:hypothetical protein [Haloferax lucentense]WEL27310.1 hypothetical protein SVXHx_3102 [Haloferax lucentense]